MGFTVSVMLDCYKGLDEIISTSVYAKSANKRPIEADIDDPDMNKPTLIESLVDNIKGKQEDPDAEVIEEEDEEEKKKSKQKSQKKNKKNKKKAKNE